jgi:hypothetical protein
MPQRAPGAARTPVVHTIPHAVAWRTNPPVEPPPKDSAAEILKALSSLLHGDALAQGGVHDAKSATPLEIPRLTPIPTPLNELLKPHPSSFIPEPSTLNPEP